MRTARNATLCLKKHFTPKWTWVEKGLSKTELLTAR
jgi:hypothetical protein